MNTFLSATSSAQSEKIPSELMYSYNIPEFVSGKVRADRHAISRLMRKDPGKDLKFSE